MIEFEHTEIDLNYVWISYSMYAQPKLTISLLLHAHKCAYTKFCLCLLSFFPNFFFFALPPSTSRALYLPWCTCWRFPHLPHCHIPPSFVCVRVYEFQKRFRQPRLVVCTQTLLTCEYLFKLHILCIKYSHLKLARISKFKFSICVCMPNIMRWNGLHRFVVAQPPKHVEHWQNNGLIDF